ncbi:major facilitator superfamily domain-containing protein [Xylariales sp. PMI_506]|nr:major facilitator superfamily domain-containing protein [Xylariales sp. PMI_506]
MAEIETEINPERLDREAFTNPNLVDWDGPEDPSNPRNWSRSRKLLSILLISLSVLYSNMATTMFASGAPFLAAEFRITNNAVATLAVTIPSLGASVGSIIFAPLSETFGRVPVYWASSALYLGSTIGCARSTGAAMFLVFRFICGSCAGSFTACGGGTVADMLPREERGSATAVLSVGPLLGPVIGPVIGGFVTEALGWRWTFYLVLIVAGIVTSIGWVAMRESNAAVILARKATRLSKQTGNNKLRPARANMIPVWKLMERSLIRPLHILIFSPMVMFMGMYMAVVFGMTYLLFVTFPTVYESTYGWGVGVSGLAYLGVGLGCFIGVVVSSSLSDKLIRSDSGPECRLLLMIWIGPSMPIGLIWYGWAAQNAVHWIVPIIGTIPVGLGIVIVTTSAQLYITDMFGPEGAASALGATMMVRSGSGAFLPLVANPLYERIGLGWGNTVLGFIVLAFAPVPVLFYRYGPYLRAKFPRGMARVDN